MKAVVQRVESTRVVVDGREVSRIGKGLLVFLGVAKDDDRKDADYLLDKIINLRIFEDREGKMNASLLDLSAELMVVSQFTLLADCRKGRRPSFGEAADPAMAKPLYEYFVEQSQKKVRAAGGIFQAMMRVELVNDGPVTILLDSKKA
ncbi:MAG: D-tyrosyl-tRNA(Tyr) deacylase [Syntrophobacterales bacterium]|nr:D-tyrosyl-tRNA(Tyr) deacylase [Syntrophobacterales bacterium]